LAYHPDVPTGIESLAQVPLFADLTKRSLRRVLRQMNEHRYAPGARIVTEGTRGETMFVLLEGTARVTRGGRSLRRLGPGEFFGEIALLDRRPRSASVVAIEPVRTLALHRHDLRTFLAEEPQIGWSLLETLAHRLRGD
jgi:CRP-like cAMP-binding protein